MKTVLFTDTKKCDCCNKISYDGLLVLEDSLLCPKCMKKDE